MGGSISDGILFYRQKLGKNLKKGPIGIQICSRDVKLFGNTRKRAMELVQKEPFGNSFHGILTDF